MSNCVRESVVGFEAGEIVNTSQVSLVPAL
jgi:hypothetical protein